MGRSSKGNWRKGILAEQWRGVADEAAARSGTTPLPDRLPYAAPRRRISRLVVLTVCSLLILGVVLIFGQTVQYDFINYDDQEYVYDNEHVTRGLTAEGLYWALTTDHARNWHPLTWLSHMLDCQIYETRPGGHHATSVLLHAANAVLLFLVLWRMTGDFWPGALVAAVFAVHPLRAESVAWVAERKDVLSSFFFLLTVGAYLGYVRHAFSLLRYLAVIALFALGVMAKPMVVTLPLVLLLLDYWPLGRMRGTATRPKTPSGASRNGPKKTPPSRLSSPLKKGTGSESTGAKAAKNDSREVPVPFFQRAVWDKPFARLVVEKTPLFALTVVSCAATYLSQGDAIAPLSELAFQKRVANALASYAAYCGHFFYPLGLAVLYPLSGADRAGWRAALGMFILTVVSLTVLLRRHKNPYLTVGWFWYLGMLVPVIGLMQVGEQAMADRYTYLPQIGLGIALAWGAAHVGKAWPYRSRAYGAAAAILLSVLAVLAWRQTSYWRDGKSLWTHCLECAEPKYAAHNNLGVVLSMHGQIDEAIAHYRQALKIAPHFAEAHNNLGNALATQGKIAEAAEHYRKALAIKPNSIKTLCFLGNILASRGQYDEAIGLFQKAVKIQPDLGSALNNLAWLRATSPQPALRNGKEAVELALRAARLGNVEQIDVLDTLAAAYAEAGQFSEAVKNANTALKLAVQQGKQPQAKNIQARIRLYESKTPYRETSTPKDESSGKAGDPR